MKSLIQLILSIIILTLTFSCHQKTKPDSFLIEIISKTNNYIQKIDSTKTYRESIAEGTFEIVNTGRKGGFSTYCLSDDKTIYRIKYQESIDTSIDYTFYYKDNNLIYSKLNKKFWSIIDKRVYSKLIFEQEVYFLEGKVLFSTSNNVKPSFLYDTGVRHYINAIESFNSYP